MTLREQIKVLVFQGYVLERFDIFGRIATFKFVKGVLGVQCCRSARWLEVNKTDVNLVRSYVKSFSNIKENADNRLTSKMRKHPLD